MPITPEDLDIGPNHWKNTYDLTTRKFICGVCEASVASQKGYLAEKNLLYIYICPACNAPNVFVRNNKQYPEEMPGHPIRDLPAKMRGMYIEARMCIGSGAYSAGVLLCRKILSNLAVKHGADPDLTFYNYMGWLAENGYVPPHGKKWISFVQSRGNEASHEIVLFEREDAIPLLLFSEMILRFVYEFPEDAPGAELETGHDNREG